MTRVEIENEKQAAISDIRKLVATLSVEIAEKIMREKLGDDNSQMELIDRMLDDVSSKEDTLIDYDDNYTSVK